MTIEYLPPGRPGESAKAALHRKTDSPAQDRLRRSARRAGWFVPAFALLPAVMMIHDGLMIDGIRATAHPSLHRGQGVVDVMTPSRRQAVFRLSRPGEPALLFQCSASVDATPRCPTPSDDWRAREMTVEWITMPTLLRVVTPQRATRMAAGDDIVFVATPLAVQQAEVADLRAARQGGWKVFGGLMLASGAIALFQWCRLWFLTRKIEAAHRRARG